MESDRAIEPSSHQDPIFNISNSIRNTHALYAAHELNLFQKLHKHGPMSSLEISKMLGIEPRATQALISMCASLGLLSCDAKDEYCLTQITKDYLLQESPLYWGELINIALMNPDVLSYEKFKEALFTNTAKVVGDNDFFEMNEENKEQAKFFTRAMHSKSVASAQYWPKIIDLSKSKCLLDVAGGSGAHAISAVQSAQGLHAIIFDRPYVCEVTNEFVTQANLNSRIQVQSGNMWTDPFPSADVHFYCDIFHDWPLEKCLFLAKKSFECLPTNGKILIHELLFNDTKTGPLSTASYNVVMLLWTQGQQYSKKEMISIIKEVGFVDIEITPSGFGDWSLISGRKN